jgi:hypothetical protein
MPDRGRRADENVGHSHLHWRHAADQSTPFSCAAQSNINRRPPPSIFSAGSPGVRRGLIVDNGVVAILEVVVVLGIIGLVIYATVWLLTRPKQQGPPVSGSGRWRASHYDQNGKTLVVLQKISPRGTNVLDEHIIATIRTDDPEYDDKFLSAMSSARQRQALFETEE